MGTPREARRKNDDSPRNLRYLTFPESFYWLIAKAQTQDPIRSLEKLETRFFPQAILANQRHGKRANGYFGVRNQDIKTAGAGRILVTEVRLPRIIKVGENVSDTKKCFFKFFSNTLFFFFAKKAFGGPHKHLSAQRRGWLQGARGTPPKVRSAHAASRDT